MKRLRVSIEPPEKPCQNDPTAPEVKNSGSVRIEVVVSDAQAEELIDSLRNAVAEEMQFATTSELVAYELQEAGPNAVNLYHDVLSRVERELIKQVLAACDGIQTKTAARLGINRNTLHKRLQQYGFVEAAEE